MEKLNFRLLEARYGEPSAYHWLAQIEKAAGIASDRVTHVDPEVRLANAIWLQDVTCVTHRRAV